MRAICISILSSLILPLGAQLFPEIHNEYQSAANPYYWKNRPPHAAYWQQDVNYQIRATLNDQTEIIEGEETLVYTNNSPNTLHEAFFHLYQNSVQPGSLTDELYHVNKVEHRFSTYESQGKGTTIESLEVNGIKVNFEIDHTVLHLQLPMALKPGESCTFHIKFNTYFGRGSIRRRMKVWDHDGFKHFNTVHWYPRICVYDAKFTWETAQHLEKEFYGNFGQYDVEITLPNHYIMEATGVNTNRLQVLPPELWQKIQISNFANKPKGSPVSIPVTPDGTTKTWKFHALNVHDFAWTADPTYRIGISKYGDIECIALAQENNAAGWQPTADFVRDVVRTYSEDFGMYAYPKMVAADAADGMEYPMLTLDGGVYPGHKGLIAHEVGHNWFFGMVGSNETYRASLDEGFTQFLTSWSMRKLSGQFTHPNKIDINTVYYGYLGDAMDGEDAVLNTHSDDFHNAVGHGGGYRHVYYKTATMLYNLEYVLGDSVFLRAMSEYFNRWKFAHPYVDDFRNSITQSVKTDLVWFFDQWFETTKYIDYKIGKITNSPSGSTVTIKRKGDMIMPLDLRLNTGKGYMDVTIPVSNYKKPGTFNATPWLGWGAIRKNYTLQLHDNLNIQSVELDPSGRLADINRLNDHSRFRMEMHTDYGNSRNMDYTGPYQMQWRPDIWYNHRDGVKFGLHLNGQYALRRHIFNAWVWYGSGLLSYDGTNPYHDISYAFNYTHKIRKAGQINIDSRFLGGALLQKLGWSKDIGRGNLEFFGKFLRLVDAAYMGPYHENGVSYAFMPQLPVWEQGKNNISMNAGYTRPYNVFGNVGNWKLRMRLSTPWSDYSYGGAEASWTNDKPLGKLNFRSRIYAVITNSMGNMAPESTVQVAGANMEERYDNKYTRDFGNIPLSDLVFANSDLGQNLHLGGSLNLRGFNGYAVPISTSNGVLAGSRGNRGASVNTELDFSRLFSFMPHLSMLQFNLYAFGDAGLMAFPDAGKMLNTGVLADAGLGTVISIRNWGNLLSGKRQRIATATAPLRIRVDFPFFLNAVQETDDFLKFRWMVGIGKAF